MQFGLNSVSKRKVSCCLALLAVLFSFLWMALPGPASAGPGGASEPATSLTIKVGYTSTANPTTTYATVKTFTEAEMTAMANVQQAYSLIDSMPAPVTDAAKGVLLSDLLTAAGIDMDNVNKCYFYCADITTGPYQSLTRSYLYDSPRYYYPNIVKSWNSETGKPDLSGAWGSPTDGAVQVYPLLAAEDNWARFQDPPDFNNMSNANKYRFLNGQTESDYANGTITASKSAKWVCEIDVMLNQATPPALSADTTGNTVGQPVTLTFTDDAAWRAVISGVTVNGADLTGGQYSVENGSITIDAGVFTAVGDYPVVVKATGYTDATVTQTMNEAVVNYTATFVSDGGTYAIISAAAGSAISAPADPVKDGFEFVGWYSDESLTTAVTFPHTLAGDITLYAKWTQAATAYTVTIDSAITGGTVTADKTSAAEGEPVTLTVTPATGKKLMAGSLQYTTDGTGHTVINGTSFAMPAADVTVTATFIASSSNPDAWDGSVDTSWYNTADTSFSISTPAQMAGLAAIVNGTAGGLSQDSFTGKTVALTEDIDLGGLKKTDETWDTSSVQWTSIGGGVAGSAFNGIFNGGGHVVSNLYIFRQPVDWGSDNSGNNVGLFGIVDPVGNLKNLGVTGNVSGNRSVGGLVGKNHGTIENCFNAATVSGAQSKGVGGIAGANWTTGTVSIINCYNVGTVTTTYSTGLAGGMAGDNENLISGCYNAGQINASQPAGWAGGIAGNLKGGSPTVTDCYYNSDLNSKGIGGGSGTVNNVAGKTTAEMKTAEFVALLNANDGNAFAQDTNNINNGYPILSWQAAAEENAKYTVTAETDEAYQNGTTADGLTIMTVNTGVTGLKYFGVQITPVTEHSGQEAVVFVHLRDSVQLSINVTKADFDLVGSAQSGFNVQPGDIIKVFIVDDLTNDVSFNPTLLQ
jgi:uncharacterized repeat protein (TIGR02543 family)